MAQLASVRQMSSQVLRGSAGEYQADEQAGVARLFPKELSFFNLHLYLEFVFILCEIATFFLKYEKTFSPASFIE